MRRLAAASAFIVLACAPLSSARAGVYGDDLSRCLVKSTTSADQVAFMVWMFSALGAHPAVKSYTTFTDAQRDATSATAAHLMQRLMTEDCRSEAVAALKYEGESSIQLAFSGFGQAAVRGLMSDPAVNAAMEKLGEHIDGAKFEALAKDAGLATNKPAAK